MKRISIYLFLMLAFLITGCSEYDDTSILDRMDGLEERLENLEELCKLANTNMASLQALIVAAQRNDTITSMTAVTKDGEVVGYTVTFAKGGPITIYVNDAASGQIPQVGVKEDTDGNYYWTLGGDWMLDAEGNKIAVEEEQSPRFKVEEGFWFVSYDNGDSWEQLGPATDDSEESADSIFADVDTSQEGLIIFTLQDGSKLSVQTSQDLSYVDFLDNTVELLCIMNWDTDGDDRLSYEEAAAVKSIGNVFEQTAILSFNEFKHFTSVKKLEEHAFEHCEQLRRITLPESLEEIGAFALSQLHNLKEITIPASVTTIAERAMEGNTVMEKIVVAEGNAVYDSRGNCNALIHTETDRLLAGSCNTVIPDGIKTIGQHAFLNSQIENVIIPDSVSSIEYQAFYGCDNLGSMEIGNGVETWGEQVFYNATGNFTVNSSVPEWPNAAKAPFYSCHMSSLTFGPDVKSIGAKEFSYCKNLTKVYISENVETMGANLFTNGRSLDVLEIHCPTVGEYAFQGDDIAKLIIGDEVESVLEGAFAGKTVDVVWGSGLKSLGKLAFAGSYIKTASVDNVETVGESAFANCNSLSSVSLKKASVIGKQAFSKCTSLQSAVLSDVLETISDEAFFGCKSLKEIEFPLTLRTIGARAFNGSGLVDVLLPEGLKKIGAWAFEGCASVQKISIPATIEEYGESPFRNCTGELTVAALPANEYGYVDDYFNYADFSKIIVAEGVKEIPRETFRYCDCLTEVVLPESVISIGKEAFAYCYALRTIDLPASMETLGEKAFYECKLLERAVIREGIIDLPESVFAECHALSEVSLPESLQTVSESAFEDCDGLTEIVFPANVTKIGQHAFRDADNLSKIYFKGQVPCEIVQGAMGCYSLPSSLSALTIYVPTAFVSAYQTAWTYYKDVIAPYEY